MERIEKSPFKENGEKMIGIRECFEGKDTISYYEERVVSAVFIHFTPAHLDATQLAAENRGWHSHSHTRVL